MNMYQGERECADKVQKPEGIITLRLPQFLLAFCLTLDESFFEHLLVAEPQIGDIG
jgi:hypothetical protein